jgi:hypothetical protein
MALTYQTEYCLGRGRRVARTYSGVPALVAIGADLTLAMIFGVIGLVFGVVGWVLWLAWQLCRLVVLALRDVILTLARLVRDVVTLPWRTSRWPRRNLVRKPAMGAFAEL